MAAGGARRLAISTMRDEGPYVLEWLAYHRLIGFTDFLIYSNDCRDGTDLLLDRLAQGGHITHERNEVLRRGPQKSALKYALAHPLYAAADWVYVCDADEFLNIRLGAGRLDDLIARFPEADAIPVAWRQFSHNGLEALPQRFTVEALTDAEPATPPPGERARFVKTLFRRREEVVRLGTHGPIYDEGFDRHAVWGSVWREGDPASDPLRAGADCGYEVAQVNHYAVRTVDAFLIKRDRGRANHVSQVTGLSYWDEWCRGGVGETSILRHLPALRTEYDRLIADPVTAHLHEGARAWHRQKIAALLTDPEVAALKRDILARSGGPAPPAQTAPPPPVGGVSPETAALAVKAPKRHQNRLKLLEAMPKGGRCAEIGVWNGAFSGAILEVTQPRELVLIDPWDLLADRPSSDRTHKRHEDSDFMGEMFRSVAARYGEREDVTIRKGFSADILAGYPDGYFDWVYIDGNHLYDAVRVDLELSFRKVRPGGVVAGDDFFWKRDDRLHVREAVLDSMRAFGLSGRPTRIGQQFMITLPETGAGAA